MTSDHKLESRLLGKISIAYGRKQRETKEPLDEV